MRHTAALEAFHQHFVKHTVISVCKQGYFFPSGHRARNAHRSHHRFRTSVAEGHALVTGHLAKHFGYFAGERRLRADFEAFLELSFNRGGDKRRTVSKKDWAEAVQHIHVFVAVQIPQVRPF